MYLMKALFFISMIFHIPFSFALDLRSLEQVKTYTESEIRDQLEKRLKPSFIAEILEEQSILSNWASHELDAMYDPNVKDGKISLGELKMGSNMGVILPLFMSGQTLAEEPTTEQREDWLNAYRLLDEAYQKGYFGLSVKKYPREFALLHYFFMHHDKVNVREIFITMFAWDLLGKADDSEDLLFNYSIMVKAPLSDNISELVKKKIGQKLKNVPYVFLSSLHKALERHAFRPDLKDVLINAPNRLGQCLLGKEISQSSFNLVTGKNFCYTTALDQERSTDSGPTLGELKQEVLALNFEAFQNLMRAYREGEYRIDKNSPFAHEEAMQWFVLFSLADFDQEEKKPYMRLFADWITHDGFQGFSNLESFDAVLECLRLNRAENEKCETLLKSVPFCDKKMCINFLWCNSQDVLGCPIQ